MACLVTFSHTQNSKYDLEYDAIPNKVVSLVSSGNCFRRFDSRVFFSLGLLVIVSHHVIDLLTVRLACVDRTRDRGFGLVLCVSLYSREVEK